MVNSILRNILNSKILLILFLVFVSFNQCNAEMRDIGNSRLLELIGKQTPIIDIREESEWKETGIIEGSYLMTFFDGDGKYDLQSWMASLRKIVGKDDPVIILCRSGRRSAIVGNFLAEKARYKEVYNVKNGIKGWIKAKQKIQTY